MCNAGQDQSGEGCLQELFHNTSARWHTLRQNRHSYRPSGDCCSSISLWKVPRWQPFSSSRRSRLVIWRSTNCWKSWRKDSFHLFFPLVRIFALCWHLRFPVKWGQGNTQVSGRRRFSWFTKIAGFSCQAVFTGSPTWMTEAVSATAGPSSNGLWLSISTVDDNVVGCAHAFETLSKGVSKKIEKF